MLSTLASNHRKKVSESRKVPRTSDVSAGARVLSDGLKEKKRKKNRTRDSAGEIRPRSRLAKCLAHFMLPRIRVKRVTAGIPSLLPRRAQHSREARSVIPSPRSASRSFPDAETQPGALATGE